MSASSSQCITDEVSPKVIQARISKRKPNPACYLSSKTYAKKRFGIQRHLVDTRSPDSLPPWHGIDWESNKNGLRQLIVLDDGTEYIGEWEVNLRHGQGRHYTKDGVYEGSFVEDMYEGEGTYYLWYDETNCDQPGKWLLYDGSWLDGKMSGNGCKYFTNGDCFEGEFKNGKINGNGVMEYANGDIYEGEWVNDQRSGHGELKKENGDLFVGEWANDMKNGPGKLHIAKTKRCLDGVWENGDFKSGSYYDEDPDIRYIQPGDITGTTERALPVLELADPESVMPKRING